MNETRQKVLINFYKQCSVIDTEATDQIPTDPNTETCEIGSALYNNGTWDKESTLIGTKNPIPFAASKVNNISREMLEGLPLIAEKAERIKGICDFPNKKFIVAHNIRFDKYLLEAEFHRNEGLADAIGYNRSLKWICTYRLLRHLPMKDIDGNKLEYAQAYLKFALDLEVPDSNTAHRAGDDALVCALMLEKIAEYVLEVVLVDMSDEDLIGFDLGNFLAELSESSISLDEFPFGKHKGQSFEDVPNSYYKWCIDNHSSFQEDEWTFDEDLVAKVESVLAERFSEAS